MNNFSELPVCSVLQSNLAKLGFAQPTPVQAKAILPALDGQDVLATAQTGTGKTLAFVLPMIHLLEKEKARGITAVVLSPTRELAMQIDDTFRKLAAGLPVRSAVVVGGVNESTQLRAIRGGAQVLIATPGRLCDFLQRKLVSLSTIRLVVLDEADRMLDMGFLPSIRAILGATPATRQTLLFSATIEKSVTHLIDSQVRNPVRIAIGDATRPAEHVDLHVYEVDQDRKLSLLSKLLEDEQGSFLVFSRTKHGAERLAKNLGGTGVKAARIHGDRTQNQRNEALRGFQDGRYRVLVATDVAARGIHVDGIAHVVNYDLPQAPEDFIHRVGRTARAGARGTASTFSTRSERAEIRRIERALNIRMLPREVSSDLLRETRAAATKVVTLPVHASRGPGSRFSQRRPRTFAV